MIGQKRDGEHAGREIHLKNGNYRKDAKKRNIRSKKNTSFH